MKSRPTNLERPVYHFQPEANWMNDPNGPIQWKGAYHLFYQHHPHSTLWGPISWGHAVSSDLVSWRHLPLALTPTPGGPDADGCWSGCAVDDHGIPTLVYTGVRKDKASQGGYRQMQCIATSADDLLSWQKYPGNPVITGPPSEYEAQVTGFRDPCVWRENDAWYGVIGTGVEGVGGAVLLYRSPDLRSWEYLGPLYTRSREATEPVWTGSIWECPQFFPLGDQHVLLLGVWDEGKLNYTVYMTGTYSDGRFTPRVMRRFDLGPDYYAPASMLDNQGRRLVWGWCWEARSRLAQKAAGWAGMMSLPRVVTLGREGLLEVEPVPELTALRREHYAWRDVSLSPAGANPLGAVRGDSLEILACIDLGTATECTLALRMSPGAEEYTVVRYDKATEELTVDRGHASLDPDAHRGVHGGAVPLTEDGCLTLHVFLDRTIVEVYANGRACLTARIYPTRSDSLAAALRVAGGSVNARRLDVWRLAPAASDSAIPELRKV